MKEKKASSSSVSTTKSSAAYIRITKDLSDVEKSKSYETHFPDPDNLLFFKLEVKPSEGSYKGGRFFFSINVSESYPHDAPKVKCDQKVYHPNIDLEGNVCLNILREDWKPVLSISAVIYGIIFLFTEPNADDPLNERAAKVLRTSKRQFETNVYQSMRGYTVDGIHYDRCLQ